MPRLPARRIGATFSQRFRTFARIFDHIDASIILYYHTVNIDTISTDIARFSKRSPHSNSM
jgi:hypothetical protein